MAKKSYSKTLQDTRWQKKRLEVLEAAGWKCEWCGYARDNLQIHHGFYSKGKDKRPPWEYPESALWVLCDACHERAETARYCCYVELGKIHPSHHYHIRGLLREIQEVIAKDPKLLKKVCIERTDEEAA